MMACGRGGMWWLMSLVTKMVNRPLLFVLQVCCPVIVMPCVNTQAVQKIPAIFRFGFVDHYEGAALVEIYANVHLLYPSINLPSIDCITPAAEIAIMYAVAPLNG